MANISAGLEFLLLRLNDSGRRNLLRSVAKEIRREQSVRIGKQQDADGNRYAPRSLSKRKDQKKGKMFSKLRQTRNLYATATADEGEVGFMSRIERIAAVHQFGGMASPRKNMRQVRFPVRELLGVSAQTENIVTAAIEKALLK